MAGRIAVAVVAIAVLAWLGVMERDLRLQAGGVAAVQRRDMAGAEADLRAARLLNPDPLPDVRRAIVYRAGGREADALALLDDVLRREPDNLAVWGLLYTLSRQSDPARAARALAARRRLDPVSTRRRD